MHPSPLEVGGKKSLEVRHLETGAQQRVNAREKWQGGIPRG